MESIYEQGFVSWSLWAICLGVGIICLIPSKTVNVGLRWANPRIAFGFAFLLLHVLRPFYLMLVSDYYGTRLGFYSFSSSLEMNLMLLASAMGGLAFLIGWKWGMNKWTRLDKSSRRVQPSQSVTILLRRVWVVLPFAIFALIWGSWGSISQDLTNIYYLLRCSLIAITYLLLIAAVQSKARTKRMLYFMMSAMSVLAFLWLFLQESGSSRLFLLMFVIPGFVILSFLFKRKALGLIAVSTVFLILIFMFLGNVRTSIHEGGSLTEQLETQTSGVLENVTSYFLQGGDFDAFEKGMLVIETIPLDESPYWGRTFATLFIMPIPRIFWPGKAEASLTQAIIKRYPLVPENFAVTFIGEAYGNFLWPGILMIFFLFGFVSAKVYRRYISPQPDVKSCVLLGLYMAYVILVMRGSFHSMTSYYLFCLFWFVASDWLFKLKWIKKNVSTFSRRTLDIKTD
jgi:oligosaccharide repeat unit polymerase